MVVHFNISQADEWVEKGMISSTGSLYRSILTQETQLLPRMDGLVFVSEFMRKVLLSRIPAIAQLPYVVVPNFVPDPDVMCNRLAKTQAGTDKPSGNTCELMCRSSANSASQAWHKMHLFPGGKKRGPNLKYSFRTVCEPSR
jgi:hypothetical protein